MFRFSTYRMSWSRSVVGLCVTFVTVVFIVSAVETLNEEKGHLETNGKSEVEELASEDKEVLSQDPIFEELARLQNLLEELDESETQPTYSQERRCIEIRRIKNYDALSSRFVAFEMRQSDEIYLIQFENQCPGLERSGNLTFDVRGQSGRLCVNDSIQPLDTDLSAQTATPGSTCRIPSIQRVTEVQVIQLKRGLTSNRVK